MQDIYAKFSEVLGSLTPAQATQFNSKRKPGMTVETQINVIESITGVSLTKPVKESKPIPKNNGRQEEFTEGFDGGESTETDKLLIKSYIQTCRISEADARRVLGLPPSEIEALGRHVVADYYMAKNSRFSEADCIRLAKKGR